MKVIAILCLLVGAALASVHQANVTVYSVSPAADPTRYGPFSQQAQGYGPYSPLYLYELNYRPFVFVYPSAGKLSAVYVTGGFQGFNAAKYHHFTQHLLSGDACLVLAYPYELPRDVVDQVSYEDLLHSVNQGHVSYPQLPQLAAEIAAQPVLLVQSRKESQYVRQEDLKEAGVVRVTAEGTVQVVRDVAFDRLYAEQRYPFYNPYGYFYQGYPGYEYQGQYPNYGFQGQYPSFAYQGHYPRSGYQGQYPYYGFQGQYPSFAFQGQYPYYGFQGQYPSFAFQGQYPYYGFQGQYPSFAFQGQYPYYSPDVKHHGGHHVPAFPAYNFYQGYYGSFPGYQGGLYGYFGNPFTFNYPSPAYPFYFYGQKTQQDEQANKGYQAYQYQQYYPFSFYEQPQYQHQHQYQYQYPAYPMNYQYYAYPQPAAKQYQYQQYPYQYQSYFQQYYPYSFQQYQPYQYQYQYYPNSA